MDETANPLPSMNEDELKFLLDEGLEMLSVFRRIRDREQRDLIVELMRGLVDGQSDGNGSA